MVPAARAAAMSAWDVAGGAGSVSHVQVAVHRVCAAHPTSPSQASRASTTPLPQSAELPVVRAALNRAGLRRFALTVPRAVPHAGAGIVTVSLTFDALPHWANRAFTTVALRFALILPGPAHGPSAIVDPGPSVNVLASLPRRAASRAASAAATVKSPSAQGCGGLRFAATVTATPPVATRRTRPARNGVGIPLLLTRASGPRPPGPGRPRAPRSPRGAPCGDGWRSVGP